MTARAPLFRLFVYGTLKRGCSNHARYCQGVVAIEAAFTLGRLYMLPQGYPMLVVPVEHQLAIGTRDSRADLATQCRAADEWGRTLIKGQAATGMPTGEWEQIAGEVLSFFDPEARLPSLDRLEDFQPGGASLYERALVPVHVSEIEPVWTYVAPGGQPPPGARRIGPVWTD